MSRHPPVLCRVRSEVPLIPLGPVTSSAGTTYTALQVQALLNSPSLAMRWFFDQLDAWQHWKADLSPQVDWGQPPVITAAAQAVKRSLRFTMRSTSTVNTLQDLIRLRYQILAPDGGWLQWVIGLFMFTPPVKEIHEGFTWWQITAPDLSQLLADATFLTAYSISTGTSYPAAIRQIVASAGIQTPLSISVPDPQVTLPASLSWDSGTSRLKAINDLLLAINYTSAWMNGTILTSRAVPDYNRSQPVLVLDAVTGSAQIIGPLKEQADYSNAYNQITVTGQDPRRNAIVAIAENRRSDSPISLLNWHPRGKTINDSAIADQNAANARAQSELQLAARIYSTLTVGTPPFPFFEDLDVIGLTYSASDEGVVHRNYVIVSGTHTCAPGQPTIGDLQRLVLT